MDSFNHTRHQHPIKHLFTKMTPWMLFVSLVIALQWIRTDSRFIEGPLQIDRSLWAPPDAYLLNITNESSEQLDDFQFELPQEKLARNDGRNNRKHCNNLLLEQIRQESGLHRIINIHQRLEQHLINTHKEIVEEGQQVPKQRLITDNQQETEEDVQQTQRIIADNQQETEEDRQVLIIAIEWQKTLVTRRRPSATKTAHNQQWHDPSCNVQCNRNDMKSAPLVILSFDGFANQYRRRNLVPSLERMGECGASTPHMYPSYPSKTFPNHYTIATGLYPESHGIIDNYVYDPRISPKVEDVRTWKGKGQYFRGEPIWSSAVRQGKKMYCLHYPGCSYNITGHNPTVDIKFNQQMNFVQKIDQMTTWLKQPAIHAS
ncbi:Ectonucleotide pyrophosphatase/phosphodiesterase C27A7.1 [Aphelenchoides bicaudatus]|nr:Ectonucleotide pyrophosphatase/phosphodiesterase C27A7.1 [Aphelenchoides bicaudatus]